MSREIKVFPEYTSVLSEWRDLLRERSVTDKEQELLEAVSLPFPNKNFEIGLSTICNYDCPFCYNHANTFYGYYGPKTIPRHVFEPFIQKNSPFRNFVFAVTGEPFLYPDILEILQFTWKHVDTLNFSTNASLLTQEIIDFLATCRIHFVNVSIDGGDPYYETFRRGGALAKFKENVSCLAQKLGDKVYFAATVFDQNLDALLKLPVLAHELGIRHIHLFGLNIHKKMRERSIRNLTQNELETFLPKMLNACREHGVKAHWAPSFIGHDLNEKMLEYLGTSKSSNMNMYKNHCYLPFERINVDPLGHINFCCYLEFLPIDVFSSSLAHWWNCREVKILRIFHLIRHFPEVCRRYCHKISSDDVPLDPLVLWDRIRPWKISTESFLQKCLSKHNLK